MDVLRTLLIVFSGAEMILAESQDAIDQRDREQLYGARF